MRQALVVLASILIGAAGSLTAQPAGAARPKPELLLQLGHTDSVLDVDLWRKGRTVVVVTIGRDALIKVWDGATGSLLATHAWTVDRRPARLVIMPGGKQALIWTRYRGPHRLDLQSGKLSRVPDGGRGELKALCHSKDRKLVAIQRSRKRVELLSLPGLTPIAEAPVEMGRVTVCRFGPRGRVLALGEGSGFVNWLDVRRKLQPIDRRKIDRLMIDDLDPSPDGQHWAILGRKDFAVWNLKTRRETARFQARSSNGFVRWTGDGKRLLIGGHGSRNLRYISPVDGKRLLEIEDDFKLARGKLRSVRWLSGFRGEGTYFAAQRRKDNSVEVWDRDRGQRIASLWGHPLHVTSILVRSDDRNAVVGTREGRFERWDLHTGARTLADWKGHRSPIIAMAFSPDGVWMATADARGTVVVRRAKTGESDRRIRGGSVTGLQFLPDNKTLAITTTGRSKLLRVDNGFEVPLDRELRGVRRLTWSPRGGHLAYRRGQKAYLRRGGKDGPEVPLAAAKPTAFAFAADGRSLWVASADGQNVRYRTRDGKPLGELKGSGPLRELRTTRSGRLVYGLGDDAAVRFWTKGSASPTLTVIMDGAGEWIAFTPKGTFDASTGGGRYIAWRVGRRTHPADRFRERFQLPGLMRLRLSGKGARAKAGSVEATWSPPPEVRIISPEPNRTTEEDVVAVQVEVADGGGGVSEVRLYHQGRLVGNTRRGLARAARQRRTFDVLLEPGRNTLQATAMSAGRVESRSATVDVHFGRKRSRVRLRLLAIGIDKYRDAGLTLKHARTDAEAVTKAFGVHGKALFRGGIESRVITDLKATRKGIIAGFEWLIASSRPDDVAVVYMAGHGETAGEEYYFLPQETRYTGLDALPKQGLSQTDMMELIRRIPARKLVVLLDTCKSGALSLGFAARGLAEKKALSVLGQAAGVYLVAASTSRQVALEDAKLGHGLFTWSLLAGLGGKADFDRDRSVTIRELVTFLESEVARVSKESFGQEQFPVTHGTGRNFPIAILPR